MREPVLRRIAAVPGYGKLFRFDVSGVKNTPAHKGLFMGNAGGNPRMKSLCECAHNILHNASASLLGNHGRDAAHLHESNAALMAETHAAGEMQGVRRIAAEKVNLALIEAAKEAKAAPVTMGGAHASLEELSGEATSSSLQSEDETTTSDPTDFLAQMNLTH